MNINTPIVNFVNTYSQGEAIRFHMPGHKGQNFLGLEHLDITEINGADDLFAPNSIILDSENEASAIFHTAHSYFCTGGSSGCIKAMIFLAMQESDNNKILAGRNAHKSFIHAAALLDLNVQWMYGEQGDNILISNITPQYLESELKKSSIIPMAVYVTSPDYLGNILDIQSLAKICDKYNVMLIVDNAHGAYLTMIDHHPIQLGATMCCDSAHKTLPVLTGGAYLHTKKHFEVARSALAMFNSTSPSYLILQSLDMANNFLKDKELLFHTIELIKSTKHKIRQLGFYILETEPLKITIFASKTGITGIELAQILEENNIYPEYSDEDFVVLMCTSQNSSTEYKKLLDVLSLIPIKNELPTITFPIINRVSSNVSIRSAMFSKSRSIKIEDSLGLVCSKVTASCPPAIPLLVPGEVITKEDIAYLKNLNILEVSVMST